MAQTRKKPKEFVITLRKDAADRLTLGDLLVLERFGSGGEGKVEDVVRLLEKVIVEDPRTIPLSQFRRAVDMIADALTAAFGDEEAKN